ncbi:hypothetical protein KUV89_04955 [Marinobacter hydrocarbonoclasticus]|nr:hypothetical protein [Marinobacter nauticus]
MKPLLFIAALAVFVLGGCDARKDTTRPESIAIAFFDALYNQADADTAMTFVNEELRDVMRHYRIASQIQRNVIGLSLDEAELSIGEVEIDFFRRNTQQVEVLVRFNGVRDHRQIRDDRLIRLERMGEKWVITHLYSDPFQTNG